MNHLLRSVTIEDSKLLFDWVNDPEVRNASFNSDPISWFDHTNWLKEKIHNSTTIHLILELDGIPVGQIRLEGNKEFNHFTLSYSISKEYRKKSLGTLILNLGLNHLSKKFRPPYSVIGFVKSHNIASQKSFIKNEFNLQNEFEDRKVYIKHIS